MRQSSLFPCDCIGCLSWHASRLFSFLHGSREARVSNVNYLTDKRTHARTHAGKKVLRRLLHTHLKVIWKEEVALVIPYPFLFNNNNNNNNNNTSNNSNNEWTRGPKQTRPHGTGIYFIYVGGSKPYYSSNNVVASSESEAAWRGSPFHVSKWRSIHRWEGREGATTKNNVQPTHHEL